VLPGINFCFARLLLRRGVNVLLADLALRREATELVDAHSKSSPRAVFLKTDVTSWLDLSQMFEVAHEEFGGIDIVCAGAGVFEPHFSNFWRPPGQSPSKDDPYGDRYACLDINITHPIRVTQLAISYFLSAKPGVSTENPKSIVHISSIAGQSTSLATPLYHASKHAISAFVRSLAQLENTLGIRVAAVAPGIIKTPLWTEEKLAIIKAEDEWVFPEDVAEVMVDLVDKTEVSTRFGESPEQGETVKLGGGSIIEVSKGHLRDVQQFNDPGPSRSAGTTASGIGELIDEVHSLVSVRGWGKLS
jgi:3-hydroxybutyrate dehydrogenase